MPAHVEVRTDHRLTSESADKIATPEDARSLHEWGTGTPQREEPVTVAVMDSGLHQDAVDDHPWFEHTTVAKRYDATGEGTGGDLVGHGTACGSVVGTAAASVIAEVAGDDLPVEFYDVRIFGDEGRTSFGAIRDAYNWLIDHADEIDIVNMSWGARQDVPQINQLHEKLMKEGVHDVVAAGNTGSEGGSPATAKRAFSAGAVDENGDLTRFTSRDPNQENPDVAAVGKNVKLARAPGTSMGSPINDQFTKASGTSFSAPYTAAAYVIALYQKSASWDSSFERAAEDIPGSKADGEGLLKVAPALSDGTGDGPDQPNPQANATVWDFLGSDTIFLGADWLPTGDTVVEKVDETKEKVVVRFGK